MSDRRLVTLGVLLGIFLAGIEGTVVSTAMPTVVQSLGGLELYSWVFASYMLFAAVSMPIHGKLSDVYGRKRLFVIGVGAFVAGSVLSGLATSMPQLVAFRTLQGIGGGAMFAIPYTILGVVYPPEERGRAMGYGAAVWGISSVIGPVLGFLIVDTLGWRWVFFVSVPVGVLAVALVVYALEETTGDTEPHVDIAGAAALAVGVGAPLLGLQLLEGAAPLSWWLSAFAVGAVGMIGFAVIERRAREPILAPSLFSDRVFLTTNAVAFLTSFAVFAAIAYVPLFVQSARGGAISAALAIFPVSIGWSGTSILAGRLVERVGERRLIRTGSAVLVAGFAAASLWTPSGGLVPLLAVMFVIGVGMGSVTIPLLTAIQNHFGTDRMGVATSSQQFFRNLGGTVGIALLGVVMTATMRDRLASVPGVSTLGDLRTRLLGTGGPPTDLLPVMAEALTWTFGISVAVCLLAAAIAFVVPSPETGRTAAAPADD